jgi:hypothetical protein
MKPTSLLVFALALLLSLPALANDQQKAQKELNQITAMARDLTARNIVNLTLSQTVNVSRVDLAKQRLETGLNYGSLFLAHELIKGGATLPDISTQLKAGKKIQDIANDRHVDWKAIASDAKKFNSTVDNNLDKYFISEKSTLTPVAQKQPEVELYDVHHDGVKADADDVSQSDIDFAAKRYQNMKESAAKAKGDNKEMTLEQQRIGYADHTGGPSAGGAGQGGAANTSTGVSVPGFGGPQ